MSYELPLIPVGFDYPKAVLKIKERMTYAEIAEYCGYASPTAVLNLTVGAIPSHPQGEAIWVLYQMLFGSKPPVNESQQKGEYILST